MITIICSVSTFYHLFTKFIMHLLQLLLYFYVGHFSHLQTANRALNSRATKLITSQCEETQNNFSMFYLLILDPSYEIEIIVTHKSLKPILAKKSTFKSPRLPMC